MSRIQFGSSLSMHPVPAHATGEVVGDVLGSIGPRPVLAVLFVTNPLTGTFDDIVGAVGEMLQPEHLVAVTTSGVLGAGSEVTDGSALALWAVHGGSVETFLFPPTFPPIGSSPTSYQAEYQTSYLSSDSSYDPQALSCRDDATGIVVFGDESTFALNAWVQAQDPALPLAGALLASRRRFGDPMHSGQGRTIGGRTGDGVKQPSVMFCNGVRSDGGAIAVAFGPEFRMHTLVGQSCRPIGKPFTVTKAERNVVYSMGGHSATAALDLTVDGCSDDERLQLRHGMHLGVVVNAGLGLRRDQSPGRLESQCPQIDAEAFDVGDFVVHNVLGADRAAGAIAISGQCEIGDIVQFHARDANCARSDLTRQVADSLDRQHDRLASSSQGALLFSSPVRGTELFGIDHHDAGAIAEFPTIRSAGVFCAGQIGPAGDRTTTHLGALSVALLSEA